MPTFRYRECGQIHGRVYAMLGMLPKPFEFDIDYSISTEELMIRTEVFMNSVATRPGPMNWIFGLTEAFRCYIQRDILSRTTWYWNVSEVIHNLSRNIIGGFPRVDDLKSQEISRLLSDFICWILAVYGTNLFPTVSEGRTKGLTTKLTSFRPFQEIDGRAFTLNWIYSDHGYAYHFHLKHKPSHPYSFDQFYARTALESIKCRELLLAYNENAQLLTKMQQGLVDWKDYPREPRTYSDPSLPLQVKRAVFANLMARLFVRKIEEGDEDRYPERSTPLGGFLLEGDREETGIDNLLLESLFHRYRVVFEEDQHTEHPAALQVFSRSGCPQVPGGLEKVWSAYLYRNE